MKVLIVARCKNGRYAPFISEQVDALRGIGVECEYFGVKKRGYVKQIPEYIKAVRNFKPDVIHAHYGISGMFATLQHKVPVVVTFHGSDINNPKILKISKIAANRSAFNIFVSKKNIKTVNPKGQYALIPCGINLDYFPNISKETARKSLGLSPDVNYILFAGAFDNAVKNAGLAKESVSCLDNVELLELKGYSRSEVSVLMHAVDALLMTSYSEGSPQVIKEALACGCPIVSVDVGDVKEITEGVKGCYIASYDAESIADALVHAVNDGQSDGKERLIERKLTNDAIAKMLYNIYNSLI